MKNRILLPLIGAAATVCVAANIQGGDNMKIVKKMSLADKALFVIGTGMAGMPTDNPVVGATRSIVPGAAGTTRPIDSLGVVPIVLADGPAGLRIDSTRNDGRTYYCTHFPIGTLLACTWNQKLVEQVGNAIGEEVKEYGADILLAPALNIMRNPLCGRNFEYYSEDPLVAGKIAAAYVRGIQAEGVGTSIKHFAVNNQETNRMKTDARVSRRALREIYLKGFEIAVKEAKPWTVMSSYNHINGQYASESKDLLTTILRDEWGYGGVVMTDWYGGKSGAMQMWAGNDMLQPGRPDQTASIIDGVKKGTLDERDLDRNICRTLDLIAQTPRAKGYKCSNAPDLKAHAATTRQSAAEGMVLLKNNGVLPLSKKIKKVVLYGCTSYDFIAGGTGSGNVNHAYVVSLLDGLRKAGYCIDEATCEAYAQHIDAFNKKVEAEQKELMKTNPQMAAFASFLPKTLPDEKTFDTQQLKRQAGDADVAIITLGRLSGEFQDRHVSDFVLSDNERTLLQTVCAQWHAAGKKVVVLLNVGGAIETASWKNLPDAILCAWQAGQEGGNSVADVLSGNASPSGKLTMTWPVKYDDAYSSRNFPIDQPLNVSMSTGGATGERKDVDFTNYEEDVYVGYRYFDSFGIPVSYPFGFGLSYTSFKYSGASITRNAGSYVMRVTITNSGKHEGKETVQLYVAAPDSKTLNKPEKELKAFCKTRTLKPGESQTVELAVKAADLASFDEQQSAWRVDDGEYKFLVAASSVDVRATLTAHVDAQLTKVNDVLKPQVKLNLLHR